MTYYLPYRALRSAGALMHRTYLPLHHALGYVHYPNGRPRSHLTRRRLWAGRLEGPVCLVGANKSGQGNQCRKSAARRLNPGQIPTIAPSGLVGDEMIRHVHLHTVTRQRLLHPRLDLGGHIHRAGWRRERLLRERCRSLPGGRLWLGWLVYAPLPKAEARELRTHVPRRVQLLVLLERAVYGLLGKRAEHESLDAFECVAWWQKGDQSIEAKKGHCGTPGPRKLPGRLGKRCSLSICTHRRYCRQRYRLQWPFLGG
eukprot:scaffold153005_cov32-Tisochrysis_lutea.AAC.1